MEKLSIISSNVKLFPTLSCVIHSLLLKLSLEQSLDILGSSGILKLKGEPCSISSNKGM